MFGNEPIYEHYVVIHYVDVAYSNSNLTIKEDQIIAFEDQDPFKLWESGMARYVCPQVVYFNNLTSMFSSLFSPIII